MSIYDLIRGGTWPGQDGAGTIDWTAQPSGRIAGSIAFKVRMSDPATAHVRLIYRANKEAIDHRIALSRTPCHFGGWRWWFICPLSGCRVGKLHLAPGAMRFAGRQAQRLTYQSCRSDTLRRSHDRKRRLHGQLRAAYLLHDTDPPLRPKGMHTVTYERLTLALAIADMHHWEAWAAYGERLMRRISR